MCYIFEKHGVKDIKYDIPVCQMENMQIIHKYANTQKQIQTQNAWKTQHVIYFWSNGNGSKNNGSNDIRSNNTGSNDNGSNGNGSNDNWSNDNGSNDNEDNDNKGNDNEDNDNEDNLNQIVRIILRTFLEHLVLLIYEQPLRS